MERDHSVAPMNRRERLSGDKRITPAMEDYLKEAFKLQEEGHPATTQRLAERLGFSGPSVTNMVKRLDELRLARHTPYQGIELTEAGNRVALEVIRHHRLIELYLANALGYEWDEVHEEAERLEHYVSEALEERMAQALGYPSFDPHGDPIPSREGSVPDVVDLSLADLAPGSRAVVRRVSDDDRDQLRYLGELGIRPGVVVEMIERHPFDGPLRIKVESVDCLLSLRLGITVRVEPILPESNETNSFIV